MEEKNRAGIIIPVYNAFEDFINCFKSIQKWTDLSRYPLILVDDCSTDERVWDYLKKISSENVKVVRNVVNQGFSASINIGLKQLGTYDAILLNSDTQVTKGWAEKLTACAYSDHAIATVTPLSNNATLCSVPDFCRENEIPAGYTLDEYASLIEQISFKMYPEIPVANGFCMYIKREVIDVIGDFDAETFGRGYGEENDFCYRALEAGYCHVMCDDTYILHTGTKSFISDEKQRYIRAHEMILEKRYPKLSRAVEIHCRDNPNAVISENIRFWTDYGKISRRQTIMYLLQSDFRPEADDHTGGTQLHVRDLTEGLRDSFDILAAARDKECLNLTLYTADQEFLFRYYIGPPQEYSCFRSRKFACLYAKALDIFHVSCVHIHHTKGMSLELYYEAQKRDIPVLVTLHDYYYVCPTIHLLDHEGSLCTGRKKEERCRVCLEQKCGIAQTVPYLSIWQKENLKALKTAQTIIVPSQSAKNIITEYFPETAGCMKVIGHGMPLLNTSKALPQKETEKKRFRIAFLGGISTAKGYRAAVELIKKRTNGIHWYLFGQFEAADIRLEMQKNFTNIGPYQREHLPQLIAEHAINLVCILSLCPETFSYTLSEALACGVPVVVSDIGALGERVRQMECGWIVPAGASAGEILAVIQQIRKDTEGYHKMVSRVRSLHLHSTAEMCNRYRNLYQDSFKKQADMEDPVEDGAAWLFQGILNKKGWHQSADGIAIEEQLRLTQERLTQIENCFAYKLGVKIVSMVPFKRQLKDMVLKLYRRRGK